MKITQTNIKDILLITPKIFSDARGDFRETYQEKRYKSLGINCSFVQDNVVHSKQGVFRGLHFQSPPYEQAKLITVITGKILDIALDIRPDSPTYLKQVQVELKENEQVFIPVGFAHAYYVLSDQATISYKVSAPYAPEYQSGIRWDEPKLKLSEIIKDPILSVQDSNLPYLKK
ncbi:MAG: dTDP-4-dehydrorhamnose 3,5-epimerase [Candidatus Neomarinimicrobiota bacterium]|jgi:dTDP-4-dehydrorhamnose 3,5-epimerase